jgi:putative signal transducing protein
MQSMPGEPIVIYSAANVQQAYLLKGLLEERGIAAWVVNDAMQIAGGELPLGWTAAARVVVSEQDADEARRFAMDFDHQTAHPVAGEDERKEAPPADEWSDWPLCPQCQSRRSARCAICGTSGKRFPLADVQQLDDGERVLLYCATCDDHFLPEWFRLCPSCGHDFGEGVEVERPAGPKAPLNARAWLVLAGMLAGCAVVVAYLLWLFSQ